MNATDYATIQDNFIRHEDMRHMAAMETSSRKMALALGASWPCDHLRVPENTHLIGAVAQCKRCRRRRWNKGFKIALLRRAAREAALRQKLVTQHKNRSALIEHAIEYPGNGRLPLDTIKAEVCRYFDVDPGWLIRAPRVTGPARDARAVIYKILRERGLSFPTIGKVMGGKDHSTVVYAVGQFDAYAERNPLMTWAYLNLRDRDIG